MDLGSMSEAPQRHLFLVHCVDDPSCGLQQAEPRSGSVARIANLAQHKAYQMQTADPSSPNYIRKIASGPTVSDDGTTMTGSFFLVEATREEIDVFIADDPFSAAGVWGSVTISRYAPPAGVKAYEAGV